MRRNKAREKLQKWMLHFFHENKGLNFYKAAHYHPQSS